ncbi:hypothetical protein HMF8227_01494 [Saliniradius amylolyticus]|uniref:SapC family protein n=1 Tax=Saliniradius amylolyticus TaxID=2183582 RepID=A0A2S2E2Z8_9ALTE|nr:SapC family protein [Saliniradius amylolyticus]AWL11969.1 hypothetical protein HMF8227_01494 [Saliniradius amylolyticus]
MTASMTPLTPEQHGHLKVVAQVTPSDYCGEQAIPVTAQEFAAVASQWPVVFLKHGQTGDFQAVALMGLNPGQNLYCQNNDWSLPYMPQAMRHRPFAVTRETPDSEQLIICIDESHPKVSAHQGEALFDSQGEQTPFLKQRAQSLVDYLHQIDATRWLVNFFKQHDLLITQELRVNDKEQSTKPIAGLYMVDEQKLKQLDDEVVNELRRRGFLGAIYSHLTSLHQIQRLTHDFIQYNR